MSGKEVKEMSEILIALMALTIFASYPLFMKFIYPHIEDWMMEMMK